MLAILLRIAYLLAIGLSLYTSGWLLIKADKNSTTAALIKCQVLIIIWCIPQLFLALPLTKSMKYLAYAISYVGISFIGPAWLDFAYLYSKRSLNAWVKYGLFAISALNYSVFLSNEYHHQFYITFEVARVEYGPFFYGHMLYTYACVLGGMALVLKDFRKNRVAFLHIAIILLAAAVPLGFNVLYMTGWVKSGFDLTPPAFALSSLLMLLAVFRYDFLDVNTLAFGQIFASIAEGVVIYNRRGKITYCNKAVQDWFHIQEGGDIQDLNRLIEENGGGTDVPEQDLGKPEQGAGGRILTLENGQKIEVKTYTCQDTKGRVAAGTFICSDVGKYFELLDQGRKLAVSNQKLAIEQERNRIAQEVHDTAGHTLTMIQSLLKLIQVEYSGMLRGMEPPERNEEERTETAAEEYISQARELAAGGIRELRRSINNLKQSASCELVTQGVRQLAESVREFEVEVDIQGEDGPAYSHLSLVVYECLREAVTNCLKYADASHMDVIVKFTGDMLNLYIFDNGRGCGKMKEGNGIQGIRRRAEQAGGRFRIMSEEGAGFQMYLTFPVKE